MGEEIQISSSLLDRARGGEEAAWAELLDLLSPLVFKIIRNQIRKSSEHDDLAQEAFTKIFLKLDQFRGRQPFSHWVSRLTINTCYDWLRRQKVRPLMSYADLSESQAELLEKKLSGEAGDDRDKLSALRELLDRLIATLKPREQIVIRLLDLEEKSVREISELTGWGASKVKVTAMRARRKLRDQMEKMEARETHD